jgi:membrane protease YdiL (CAAX protease family)
VVVFCFGLLLGAAQIRTGSLMVPLGMHALENFLATAAVAFG